MTALSHPPSPRRGALSGWGAFWLLFTGPIAWFVQFNIGTALTSWPCFPAIEFRTAPLVEGMSLAAGLLLGAFALLSLVVLALAVRLYRRVGGEQQGGTSELAEIGAGRTRFVALWGIFLNGGAAVAMLATLAALMVLPRCAL